MMILFLYQCDVQQQFVYDILFSHSFWYFESLKIFEYISLSLFYFLKASIVLMSILLTLLPLTPGNSYSNDVFPYFPWNDLKDIHSKPVEYVFLPAPSTSILVHNIINTRYSDYVLISSASVLPHCCLRYSLIKVV